MAQFFESEASFCKSSLAHAPVIEAHANNAAASGMRPILVSSRMKSSQNSRSGFDAPRSARELYPGIYVAGVCSGSVSRSEPDADRGHHDDPPRLAYERLSPLPTTVKPF